MKIGAKSSCDERPRSVDFISVHPEYLTKEQAGDGVSVTGKNILINIHLFKTIKCEYVI